MDAAELSKLESKIALKMYSMQINCLAQKSKQSDKVRARAIV